MNKFDFIAYTAKRYGVEESFAEYIVDMFACSLQDAIRSGQNVEIEEIGEFKTTPLLSQLKGNIDNAKLAKLMNQNIVTFKASKTLIKGIA